MANRYLTFTLIISICFSFGCKPDLQENINNTFKDQRWRGALKIQEGEIPFEFYTYATDSNIYIEIKNGSERLRVENVRVTRDSIIFPGHIFDSEIRAKIINDSTLEGEYVRTDTKEPYIIPFYASRGKHKRFFNEPNEAEYNFTGKWEVHFMSEYDTSEAIGVFTQDNNEVFGTFLTPTGDYRFLSGQVNGKTMYLSTFDGSHAFLFKAIGSEPMKIKGGFWSGKHWEEKWIAVRNDSFELPDADSITYLKEGQDEFKFSYVNDNGETIVRDKASFRGKVTILQILGTWCPNCMDETIFLTQLDGKFEGVEIIGLTFEKASEQKYINKRIERVKRSLNVEYPIIYMGKADKDVASETFPMLNEIISFPTTIIIDKKGNVRRIHTGFSGPGTGDVYFRFTEEFNRFIAELSRE